MWFKWISWTALVVALTAMWLIAPRARAQAPDASDIAEGLRLYQQKANCQACHGWAADGRKADNQMPDGPNLRESKLGRAGLVMTIKCGRLNSSMPAFDKFAYSGRPLLRQDPSRPEGLCDADGPIRPRRCSRERSS